MSESERLHKPATPALETGKEAAAMQQKSAPAFQLKAGAPIQRKTPDEGPSEHGDHDGHGHEERMDMEGWSSENRWDALVVGGAANLQKTASSDVNQLISAVPEGAIVVAMGESGGFVKVMHGTQEGWIATASLKQVSYRLSRQAEVMEILKGKKTLKPGDSGTAVVVVQQLLADTTQAMQVILKAFAGAGVNTDAAQKSITDGKAGVLPSAVTGTIDSHTEQVLRTLQRGFGITETGCIDQATVGKLNDMLIKEPYAIERIILAGQKALPDAPEGKEYDKATTPKELLDGTRKITADQQKAFEQAISTDSKAANGGDPVFTDVPKGTYGKKIEAALEKVILDQYERLGKGKAELRKKPDENLHAWDQIEKIASKSKDATDKSFGKYRRGPALSSKGADPQIQDAWEKKEKDLKGNKAEQDSSVEWRVRKILEGHEMIKAIDKEHGAKQSRPDEAGIVIPIKEKMMKKYRKEILETHKGWSAFADEGKVFIQRFKDKDGAGKDDQEKGRAYMWRMFRTIIHEYIHTLEHSEHRNFRDPIASKSGGFALREGTTDYFTKVAYNNVDRNDMNLRKEVEGPYHDPTGSYQVPAAGAYGESQNIEAAVGIIGFPNLCAAFFLGRTDLYKA